MAIHTGGRRSPLAGKKGLKSPANLSSNLVECIIPSGLARNVLIPFHFIHLILP